MNPRMRLIGVLALLVAASAVVAAGRKDPGVSLESVARLWGDVVWDTSVTTGYLTPATRGDERIVGERLAAAVLAAYPEVMADSAYVNEVGRLVGVHSPARRQYRFHVVDMGEANAFSLPGGQVFVTSGLMAMLQSEAELAFVLGHEVSHVDLEHCVNQHHYEVALRRLDRVGLAGLLDAVKRENARAYSQMQEYDADAAGARLAVHGVYDGREGVRLLRRLGGGGGGYFTSHPGGELRARRLEQVMKGEGWPVAGTMAWVGRENLRQRKTREVLYLQGEQVALP